MRANEAMRQMANTVAKIKGDVGEIKDDVGEIKDDVGEIKCSCCATCVGSVVEAEASSQGTRSNRMFKNGFPPRTHP